MLGRIGFGVRWKRILYFFSSLSATELHCSTQAQPDTWLGCVKSNFWIELVFQITIGLCLAQFYCGLKISTQTRFIYSLCSLGLSTNQPAVFFSHTKSALAISHQPAVLFFHNKSAPATCHSQTDRLNDIWQGRVGSIFQDRLDHVCWVGRTTIRWHSI